MILLRAPFTCSRMASQRTGEIAVIFVSQRSGADEAGYAEAAAAM